MKLRDASFLNFENATVVRSADIDKLRTALKVAAKEGRTITVGGARHSMGGQSLPDKNGIAVELPPTPVVISEDKKSYTVGMGTRWRDVTSALDKEGMSVKIMQSNNDFSVGGTLSVNAHGWPASYGPFGASVKNFSIMLADGSVAQCSRTENPELFSLAIGGYGLFGIVLDAEIEAVPNCVMRFDSNLVPSADFADHFTGGILDPKATTLRMAYGRLSLSAGNFLQETTSVHCHDTGVEEIPPVIEEPGLSHSFARAIYNAQKGSNLGKAARWLVESRLGPHLQKSGTRNTVLHTPVAVFQNASASHTDILHEYFVPPERFEDFMEACRNYIPGLDHPELLNVTLRYVDTDVDSVMKFAPEPRIAAVMLFSQKIGTGEEKERYEDGMRGMTRDLIDAAVSLGGSYYLPYRLHAMPHQFEDAYPNSQAFFEKKREYDPQGIFSNALYTTYGHIEHPSY